jgi:hypothetical protein
MTYTYVCMLIMCNISNNCDRFRFSVEIVEMSNYWQYFVTKFFKVHFLSAAGTSPSPVLQGCLNAATFEIRIKFLVTF